MCVNWTSKFKKSQNNLNCFVFVSIFSFQILNFLQHKKANFEMNFAFHHFYLCICICFVSESNFGKSQLWALQVLWKKQLNFMQSFRMWNWNCHWFHHSMQSMLQNVHWPKFVTQFCLIFNSFHVGTFCIFYFRKNQLGKWNALFLQKMQKIFWFNFSFE